MRSRSGLVSPRSSSAVLPGMDVVDEFRDCARDVLAMVEAFLLTQHGADAGETLRGLDNYRVLIEHADLEGCLQVAIPMVAASWRMTGSARARANGTSEEQEIAVLLAMFRATVEQTG